MSLTLAVRVHFGKKNAVTLNVNLPNGTPTEQWPERVKAAVDQATGEAWSVARVMNMGYSNFTLTRMLDSYFIEPPR